ncbi:class I SAM-dependent methyltransferase [bacterium]|nr:class I SAM-dependent methyltransferase [bacterium]
MKPSSRDEVRSMYEDTADTYAEMMDAEIDLPVYADLLGRLQERISAAPGLLIDTAWGSGHMLSLYHKRYDPRRRLLGVDLSPRMVAIAAERLGAHAQFVVGDMRDIPGVAEGAAAAVLNFFALHHLDPEGLGEALREWNRVLRPGGQLLLAVWEGQGAVDYGEESDIIALRYGSDEIVSWVRAAGFEVTRCVVEPVEEIPMDAIYLEAQKE